MKLVARTGCAVAAVSNRPKLPTKVAGFGFDRSISTSTRKRPPDLLTAFNVVLGEVSSWAALVPGGAFRQVAVHLTG